MVEYLTEEEKKKAYRDRIENGTQECGCGNHIHKYEDCRFYPIVLLDLCEKVDARHFMILCQKCYQKKKDEEFRLRARTAPDHGLIDIPKIE